MTAEIIYKISLIYFGIVFVSIMFMFLIVSDTPWNIEPQFTPRQVVFCPFVWPWFLLLGFIWWLKTSYMFFHLIIKNLVTNKWERQRYE